RTVVLTVTDNAGGTGTQSQSVTVTAANQPPTASFTNSCTDLTCTFNASASTDSDGSIVSYSWFFGDGRTGSGVTITHTYTTPGTYGVTLIVTDNVGATGTASKNITLTVSNQAPIASYTFSCTSLNCTFNGSGSSDADGSIVSYAWNFGD